MANYYFIFLFSQFIVIFCFNSTNDENIDILSLELNEEKSKRSSHFDGNTPTPSKDQHSPSGNDHKNIYIQIEQLLIREKDLNNLYRSEYEKYINYQTQLKSQKIYLIFLIGITSVLFLILVIYSINQYLKCKRKSKKKLIGKKSSLMKSMRAELISSCSTFISNEKSNDSFEKISNDSSVSNNFNILIQSEKVENEEINNQNIENKDAEEAPIEYIDNKDKNNFNDDMKTLTNNEDMFIESKTDKLLYKPYSEEEINK